MLTAFEQWSHVISLISRVTINRDTRHVAMLLALILPRNRSWCSLTAFQIQPFIQCLGWEQRRIVQLQHQASGNRFWASRAIAKFAAMVLKCPIANCWDASGLLFVHAPSSLLLLPPCYCFLLVTANTSTKTDLTARLPVTKAGTSLLSWSPLPQTS